ncbi:MAG: hypothetical protein ACTSPY_00005 [Candidatus Helarchaeota archaeon]
MLNVIIGFLQIAMAAGFIGYWIFFFLKVNNDPEQSEVYLAHERSFPLPDLGLITPSLIISGICLILENEIGIFFTIFSSGSLFFLGLIDLAFNLIKGGYKDKNERLFSFIIIALVLTIAIINLVYGWTVFLEF